MNLVGTDDTSLQPVHARRRYEEQESSWGARHADILTEDAEGNIVVDVRRFHDTSPTEPLDDFPSRCPRERLGAHPRRLHHADAGIVAPQLAKVLRTWVPFGQVMGWIESALRRRSTVFVMAVAPGAALASVDGSHIATLPNAPGPRGERTVEQAEIEHEPVRGLVRQERRRPLRRPLLPCGRAPGRARAGGLLRVLLGGAPVGEQLARPGAYFRRSRSTSSTRARSSWRRACSARSTEPAMSRVSASSTTDSPTGHSTSITL